MLSGAEILKTNLMLSIEAKKSFLNSDEHMELFDQAVGLVIDRYLSGGRLYIAGNGGSAADAQHLAAEFVSRLSRERGPLAAEALTVDSSVLTAIGNDYGFENVFARQVEGKMTKKDVFLGITTSGRSPNILNALDACRDKDIPTIIFCGRDGGPAKRKADICVLAPGEVTSVIQEIHIVMAHALCESVEKAIFREE